MTALVSPESPLRPATREVPWRGTWLALAALTAWLLALRLFGPSTLTDNDQERPASYVLDAVRNGHWFVQYDWTGDITSKPPLYTWLAAGLSVVAGGASRWTLYLPCALAMFGSAWLIAARARVAFGSREALLAGVFLLANPLSAKLVALARTDAVFTFGVTLTAMLAYDAWFGGDQTGRHGWKRAWLGATLATLTKGPLGIVLGFSGLLAWFRERRGGAPSPWRRSHLGGLAVLLLIGGGWFLLAWQQAGDALINKMIKSELLGHAVNRDGAVPGVGLVLAPAYFLSRFAPWSLLAGWGLWRAIRTPETAPGPRRLQQFAAAWLVTGLAVLGLASHQRGDLIAPLMPAGALLAALPAARFVTNWSTRRLLAAAIGIPMLFAVGLQAQHLLHRRDILTESRGVQILAAEFLRSGGRPEKLEHVDAPFALQFELGTMHRALTVEQAAQALRQDPNAAIALADHASLARALGDDAARIRTLAAWPNSSNARLQIVTLPTPPKRKGPPGDGGP